MSMDHHEEKAHGRGWYAPPEGPEDGLFDQIVRLAGLHCGASIAVLTLTGERRQWVWSNAGTPGVDPARLKVVTCRVAEEPAAFAVYDTRVEPCWASDPAIHADPPIRACSGAPVLSPGGETIGFLCVLCLEPGDAARAADVKDALTILSRLVTGQLQLRRIFYEYETLVGELERAQATLKESEESFRLLAEHATDMISRLTPEGIFLYVSPACRAQRGYEPEELIGRSSAEFIHPEDMERLQKERAASPSRSDVTTYTVRVRRKDGTYVWVEAISRTIRDPRTGAPHELVVVSRDVTDRVGRAADGASEAPPW